MRLISTRGGVIVSRKEDGSFTIQDDNGISVFNDPEEHRNSVKTYDWVDLKKMNKAMNARCKRAQKATIEEILVGPPRR